MATKIDWEEFIRQNVREIVGAAYKSFREESICILFRAEQARASNVPPGITEVIANSELQNAVPVGDETNKVICLPLRRSDFFATLERYQENVDSMKKRTDNGAWVIACEGSEMTFYPIFIASPEHN